MRFFYTLKQAFLQFGRNLNMGFASIFAITAMLLILSVFYMTAANIDVATETIRGDYDSIEIYLKDKTDQAAADDIIADIQKVEGVDSAYFKSKEDAMKQFRERWGENGYLLENLKENPLPDSIVVKIADLEKADEIAAHAQEYEAAEDVKYYKDTVDKLLKITDFIRMGAFVIMIFLVIVSIVVVSNTIKLTVFNRADEINIMKYVGATNWFVRGPFLVEGIIIGVISAAISAGLAALIYRKLMELIGDDLMNMLGMQMVSQTDLMYQLCLVFLILGVGIGACGSIISMRRFLKV